MLNYIQHHNGIERSSTSDILLREFPLFDVEPTCATESHGTITHFDSVHLEIGFGFGQEETIRTSNFEQFATAAARATQILNNGPEFSAQDIFASDVV